MDDKMNRIIPFETKLNNILIKYSKNRPKINWDPKLKSEEIIYVSKPNILNFCNINICFHKYDNQIGFVIEYPMNNILSYKINGIGFFFTVNNENNTIDMLYRCKLQGLQETAVLYKDCKYFGIKKNKFDAMFILSNQWQDKSILIHPNIYEKLNDFILIIEYINDFIQNIINKNNITPIATPLLRIVSCHDSSKSIKLTEAEFVDNIHYVEAKITSDESIKLDDDENIETKIISNQFDT